MSKMPIAQFYEENKKLIPFAANRAISRLVSSGFGNMIEREEIISILTETFLRSYSGFEEDKAKFSTYFMMACHNRVTNLIHDLRRTVVTVQSSSFVNDEGEECFEEIFGENEDSIGSYELFSEIEYIKEGLSPFARLLFEYTINPPDFIEKEYLAQQAQSEFALSIGTRAYHKKHLGLKFIASYLKDTVEMPGAERVIQDAVCEVKRAVSKALSG